MAYHGLTLGSLDLVDGITDAGCSFHVLGDGTAWGKSNPVLSTVLSMVRYDRDDNVEHTLRVRLEAPTMEALAGGEAVLARELKRRSLLTWTPPWGFEVPKTVFSVITSWMDMEFDDVGEFRRERTYTITLLCEPFARSESLTVAEPLSVGTAPEVTIDACDSIAGWSGKRSTSLNPALGMWGGAVGIVDLDQVNTSPETWTLTRAGSVSFADTPYLVAELRTVSAAENQVTLRAGTFDAPAVATRSLGEDFYEITFDMQALPGGTASSLEFTHTSRPGETWGGLLCRNLKRTSTPPHSSSAREVSRIIHVGGTERTSGSIEVYAPDDPWLGTTMVHSSPVTGRAAGYEPSLRRRRISGNAVAQGEPWFALSGASEPLRPDPFVAEVPNATLPDGPYVVAAMIHSSVAATVRLFWTVRTVAGGDDIHGEDARVTEFDFAGGVYQYVPLGVVTLPVAQAANAVTRIDLQQDTGAAATLTLDDAFLFWATEDCGFTLLNNGKKRVWLDSPGADSPVPMWWTGDAEDKSDRHHPGDGLIAPGVHPLLPGPMRVWIASSGASYPSSRITHYERWHSNAAR